MQVKPGDTRFQAWLPLAETSATGKTPA